MKILVAFLTVLTSVLSGFSQKVEKDIYIKHAIKQDGIAMNFTVLEEDKHGVWFYDKTKFYFWYKAQKVISTQGGSSGNLLNGNFESFYDNKQLSQKGKFRKGLKVGEWIYWRKDGTITKIENWSNGNKKGKEIICDTKGNDSITTLYKTFKFIKTTHDSIIVSKYDLKKQTITLLGKNGEIIDKYKVKKGIKVEKENKDKGENDKQNGEKISIWKKLTSKFSKKENTENKANTNSKSTGKKEKKKLNWKFWKKSEK